MPVGCCSFHRSFTYVVGAPRSHAAPNPNAPIFHWICRRNHWVAPPTVLQLRIHTGLRRLMTSCFQEDGLPSKGCSWSLLQPFFFERDVFPEAGGAFFQGASELSDTHKSVSGAPEEPGVLAMRIRLVKSCKGALFYRESRDLVGAALPIHAYDLTPAP